MLFNNSLLRDPTASRVDKIMIFNEEPGSTIMWLDLTSWMLADIYAARWVSGYVRPAYLLIKTMSL